MPFHLKKELLDLPFMIIFYRMGLNSLERRHCANLCGPLALPVPCPEIYNMWEVTWEHSWAADYKISTAFTWDIAFPFLPSGNQKPVSVPLYRILFYFLIGYLDFCTYIMYLPVVCSVFCLVLGCYCLFYSYLYPALWYDLLCLTFSPDVPLLM